MANNTPSILLHCLVPSCQNSDLDIITWKKRRQDNETFPCPRHNNDDCHCEEPYTMIPFPKDNKRLSCLWIDLCQRPKDFQVKPWHGICSIHFVHEKYSEEVPFPFLKMGLQKWQIVQTVKAYFPAEQLSSFEIIFDRQFNQSQNARTTASKLKSVTIDVEQARCIFRKCVTETSTKYLQENHSSPTTGTCTVNKDVNKTLLNIPKLENPIEITVSANSNCRNNNMNVMEPSDKINSNVKCDQRTEINSAVPGIRIFNAGPKQIPKESVVKKADIPLLPVEIIEHEFVVDESGLGSISTAPNCNPKRRLKLGRPTVYEYATNMDEFLHIPDPPPKRQYRRKDPISCSLTKECTDNYDMYQSLIKELKQMTKNINELHVRKQRFTSGTCSNNSFAMNALVTINDCKQCSLLQGAYRNSLNQSRQLESEVSSAQLIQNDLLRKIATKGNKKSSTALIKKRLELTARNHLRKSK